MGHLEMYFLLKMGDIPACYVNLPEGSSFGFYMKLIFFAMVILLTLLRIKMCNVSEALKESIAC